MIVEFIGRLHPLLVHLPIGIFILAFVIEFFFKKKFQSYTPLMHMLILIGCISGVIAALCGWLLMKTGGFAEGDINTHKWSGIIMVIFSICLFIVFKKQTNSANMKIAFNVLFIFTILTVFSSAYLGTKLTYGDNFLWGNAKEEKLSMTDQKAESSSSNNQMEKSEALPEIKKADSLVIEQLIKKGFTIKPIYEGSGFLQVSAINKPTISDVEMKDLPAISENILWLDLRGTQITDKGIILIAGCKYLKKIDLHNTSISNASAETLSKLSTLEYLNITGTSIDDAGLQKLTSLSALKNLYVWNTTITKAAAKNFESKHSGLRIHRGYQDSLVQIKETPKQSKN